MSCSVPGVVMPLALKHSKAIAAAQAAAQATQQPFGAVLQHDPELENPSSPDQLHKIGTIAGVLRYVTAPDGTHHVVCQGQERFRILELSGRLSASDGAHRAACRRSGGDGPDAEARSASVKGALARSPGPFAGGAAGARQRHSRALSSPSQGADLVTSFMDLKAEERQEVLEITDVQGHGWTKFWQRLAIGSRC